MSDDDQEALVAGQADMRATIRELRADNERLRATVVEQQEALIEIVGAKDALQVEIERLRKLNDDQQKILDGTERRESEYLALIEKHATENEARRVQWEEAKREAEKWVHESGVRLGQAHKVLHERNDEIARLRGHTTRLLSENERLKAERDTTKRMLEVILHKHGVITL